MAEKRVGIAVGVALLLGPAAHLGLDGAWTDTHHLVTTSLAVAVTLLALRRINVLARDGERARRELVAQEAYFRALALNAGDVVAVCDAAGRLDYVGPSITPVLGHDPETVSTLFDLLHPDAARTARQAITEVAARPGSVRSDEVLVRNAAGEFVWFGMRASNLLDDPAVGGIVVDLHDISARKDLERKLRHNAFHDSLTGLANRALLLDRMELALARASRSGATIGVLLVDVDDFESVNDSLGHDAGNHVLQVVAGRLAAVVRAGDTLARLAADEFVLLLEAKSRHDLEGMAERIREMLAMPITVGSTELVLTAGIGISMSDSADTNAGSLLRNAHVAMYAAKRRGASVVEMYAPGMQERAVRRLHLQTAIRHAVETEAFEIRYQPTIRLTTGAVVGFEALLRWQQPEGMVPPDEFIPIAEESGLIVPLGRWVLRRACAQAAAWEREHQRPISMAVNLSPLQLQSHDLVAEVRSALAEAGLAPEHLVLEITESVLMADADVAAQRLADLRALGVRIAIDDFGVGYSSLAYLQRFPLDILKIDRSFVQRLTESPESVSLVQTLVKLSDSLRLCTVAEGIEDAGQASVLLAEGCELGQGFLFAPALRPSDADILLRGSLADAAPAAT